MKFAYACASYSLLLNPADIQSLWLTSWLSSGKTSGRPKRSTGEGFGIGGGGHEKRAVNVYTLQQPHKFPLQLDVHVGGNCTFDCHQELDRIRQAGVPAPLHQSKTPSSARAGEIYETKFIECSMGKQPLPPRNNHNQQAAIRI